MRYMLDTNICIYAIKHKPENVFEHLQEIDPQDICISSITYAELVYGVEKSNAREKNKVALSLLLSNIAVLSFDDNAAEEYGKIRADLQKKGTLVGSLDMLIAGHALSSGCILVTNNTKVFEHVSDLPMENWAKE